jgi:hypothetical protein
MSLSRRALATVMATQQVVDWKTALVIGWALCLLLLSTPGVSVVRASDDIAKAQAGQTCESAGSANVIMEFNLERLRRDQTLEIDPSDDDSAYALNSRGFNYRSEPARVPSPPSQGAR